MQSVIVVVIIAVAAVYVGRRFYRGLTQKDPCQEGCSCCSQSDACGPPAMDTPPAGRKIRPTDGE